MSSNNLQPNYKETSSSNESSREIVKINVGGKSFKTFKSTLKSSKYFENLLDETLMPNNKKVNGDEIFVDRSGKLFQHILNYLRTNTVPCEDKETTKKLIQESEFYQIEELKASLERSISTDTPANKVQMVDADTLFSTCRHETMTSRPCYYLIKKFEEKTERFAFIDYVTSYEYDFNDKITGAGSILLLIPLDD